MNSPPVVSLRDVAGLLSTLIPVVQAVRKHNDCNIAFEMDHLQHVDIARATDEQLSLLEERLTNLAHACAASAGPANTDTTH